MAVKKERELSSFGIYSLSKDSALAAVGRDTKFETRYVKGVLEGIRKGIAFLSKRVFERVRGWTSGRSLPALNFVQYLPPPLLPPAPRLFQTRSGAKLRGEINNENVDSKN